MMKLKLNEKYPADFITLHNGLILKKDEDWKEYTDNVNSELKQYISQKFIIVKDEELPKVEEPKVEKKVEVKAEKVEEPKAKIEPKVESKKSEIKKEF